MSYAEKLKDPRWRVFRECAFNHHGKQCKQCGEDNPRDTQMHVHHLRYISGREPWEYEMADVMVLCRECHEIIHECETEWRDLIRSMPPWVAFEWLNTVRLVRESEVDIERLNVVAARTRNEVKKLAAFERV